MNMSDAIHSVSVGILMGGKAAVPAMDVSMDGIPAQSGFGNLLGTMLSPVENADENLIAVPMAENEDMSALMMIFGNLSDRGLEALKKALSLFAENSDIGTQEIAALWADVSPKEKEAFSQLLDAVLSANGNADRTNAADSSIFAEIMELASEENGGETEEYSVMDILRAVVRLIDRSRQEKKKDEIPSELVQISAQAVMPDNAEIISAAEKMAADATEVLSREKTSPDVTDEIIQIAERIAENTDDESLEGFIRMMSAELKAEVETHSERESEMPQLMSASDRQAVMMRISSDSDENAESFSVMEVLRQANAVPEFADEPVEVSDAEAISERIISRIDMIGRIEDMEQARVSEIELKLNPENMGDLRIRIKHTAEGLVVSFAAEKAEAAQALAQRAENLAEAFASRGVKLRELSVTEQIISAGNSDDNALEYMNYQENSQQSSHNDTPYSQHFVFGDDGTVSTSPEDVQNTEIYYNREAKLWLSA